MTLFAIIIVATHLNMLELLAHDQTHWLGLRGRFGDSIANVLTAYPIGLTVEEYARVHLSHHRYYFTGEDPDFLRKTGPEWTFPMPWVRFAKLILFDLCGVSFIRILKGKRFKNKSVYQRTHASPVWLRPAYYLTILGVVAYFNAWQIFVLYWLVPLVTVLPLIVRLGAVTEHVYGMPKATIVDSSPLIILRWWEKLLLPNLNFTLHAYHHFYPSVSFSNLPKVHEIFMREGLVNAENVFHGYWSYLRYLQTSVKKSSVTTSSSAVQNTVVESEMG